MNGRLAAIVMSLLAVGLAVVAGGARLAGAQDRLEGFAGGQADVRFATVDVYIDSAQPLAAWQFELEDLTGSMNVVGIENGESRAYAGTPYYDRDAVEQDRADRIIVADYSLADSADLPRGRTRVATVHVRLNGGLAPDFRLQLIAAGDIDGRSIPAGIAFEFDDGRDQ